MIAVQAKLHRRGVDGDVGMQATSGSRPYELYEAVRGASLADFQRAAEHMSGDAIRTPLLAFPCEGGRRVRLKAENLQPLGSFKIRAATNVLASRDPATLRGGVATSSAGNFAQGLALAARRRGIALTVHAPDTAAKVKLNAIETLGASVVLHSFADWWRIYCTRETGANDGLFIHPVREPEVVIGNGVIGLEIAEQWPQADSVVVPFGGGGLVTGIALALRCLSAPVRIVACEVETSTPLKTAFDAGRPVAVDRRPSFVDGIGSNGVMDEMWPLLRELVDDVIVVSLEEVRSAFRALVSSSHLVVEGAGATALAASLSPRLAGDNVVAILSGGNIDPATIRDLLAEPDARAA